MVGQMLFAVATFVVFITAAVLMGRSAFGDWQEVRRGEAESRWAGVAVRGMVIAAVAAAIAVAAPVVIMSGNGT